MTYSLIPPILVVLSVIGIILFLMKKAPKVALLEKRRESAFRSDNDSFGQPILESEKKAVLGNYWLLILEKITRKLKITILKLENIFSSWNESIKKKRNGRGDRNIARSDSSKISAGGDIERKVMDYSPKQEDVIMEQQTASIPKKR